MPAAKKNITKAEAAKRLGFKDPKDLPPSPKVKKGT